MLSTDVQPDRLSRAKFAGQDLIDSLEGDRIGLIAFAGTSFVEAPLTVDYSAVENSLTLVDTDTILAAARTSPPQSRKRPMPFGKGESTHARSFSSRMARSWRTMQSLPRRSQREFRIFTVGVGTREGSLIPLKGSDGGTES